jgi:hypothetical protein
MSAALLEFTDLGSLGEVLRLAPAIGDLRDLAVDMDDQRIPAAASRPSPPASRGFSEKIFPPQPVGLGRSRDRV